MCSQEGLELSKGGNDLPTPRVPGEENCMQRDLLYSVSLSLSASVSLCLLLANNCPEGGTSGEFTALLSG